MVVYIAPRLSVLAVAAFAGGFGSNATLDVTLDRGFAFLEAEANLTTPNTGPCYVRIALVDIQTGVETNELDSGILRASGGIPSDYVSWEGPFNIVNQRDLLCRFFAVNFAAVATNVACTVLQGEL